MLRLVNCVLWTKISLISLLVSLFTSTQIYAAPNLLLQCLAKEETQLFKEKSHGTLYRLNQDFINELASSNDIALKKNFIDEICTSTKHSPSVGLLRLLLIKESDIYDLSLSEVEASMRPFKMGYINEFQKQVPRIFIQFIAGLQSEMPTANCLAKAIPELSLFNEKLKYLEEEMSVHEMVKDKSKIESIFKKLENLKSIRSACAQEKSAKEKSLKEKTINEAKKKNGPLKSKMNKKEDSNL